MNYPPLNPDVPEPLDYFQGVRKALQWRTDCPTMSYRVLAQVMSVYHGIDRKPGWWQKALRLAGGPSRPRGIMCCGNKRVAA